MIAKKYKKFIEDNKSFFPELEGTKKVTLVQDCPVFILEDDSVLSFKNYYDFDRKLESLVPEKFNNLNSVKEKFQKETYRHLEKEDKKIKAELKGKTFFPPNGLFQLFQYNDEWYKAINIQKYTSWSKVIADEDNIRKEVISYGFFGFTILKGDVIESHFPNGVNILIEDMKDSGDFFNNPLFKIKILSDEETKVYQTIKKDEQAGIRYHKEYFLTPVQARALFYDVNPVSVIRLKSGPKSREYDYVPITELRTERFYENFKHRLSKIMKEKQEYSLSYFLSNCGHGDSAEITLEECLCDMFDNTENRALPTHEPYGFQELFREKIAKPFVKETGFWKGLSEEASITKLSGYISFSSEWNA